MKWWVLPMLSNSRVSQDTSSYALATHGCDIQSPTVFQLTLFSSSLLLWMWVILGLGNDGLIPVQRLCV